MLRQRVGRVGAALAVGLALLGSACASDDGSSAAGGHDHGSSGGHDHGTSSSGGSAFGEPGDSSEASRTIEVQATDKLRFDPDQLSVKKGETITFEVTNTGSLDHEFVLGDTEYQRMHRDMASHGGQMNHEGNGVTVPPGETQEITWTFSEDVTVVFACHIDGHFLAGMLGGIVVE